MKLYFTLFFFIYGTISFSQSTFYKAFTPSALTEVIKTYDNGFACVTHNGDILKMDSMCQLDFYNKLSCDSFLYFTNIIQTTDSGFILQSNYNPFDAYGIGCVFKFDKSGNFLWARRYSHPTIGSTHIHDIIKSQSNGFYLIAGGCAGVPILIKCDETGDITWQEKSNFIAAMKIIEYSSDKFLLVGNNLNTTTQTQTIAVALVDTMGYYLWCKEYDNNRVNWLNDIVKTSNNEFSILVNLKNFVTNISNNVIIHIDPLGQILWSKEIFTNDSIIDNYMYSIDETSDKGHVITGNLITPSINGIIYLKSDSLNNIEWTNCTGNISCNDCGINEGIKVINKNNSTYIFSNNADGLSVAKVDHNGNGFCHHSTLNFISDTINYTVNNIPVSATLTNFTSVSGDFIYNKINVNSTLYCSYNSVENIDVQSDFTIFPNPATFELIIETTSASEIEIHNLAGQIIKSIAAKEKITTFDISSLARGMYFVKVKTEKGIGVRKFVKE